MFKRMNWLSSARDRSKVRHQHHGSPRLELATLPINDKSIKTTVPATARCWRRCPKYKVVLWVEEGSWHSRPTSWEVQLQRCCSRQQHQVKSNKGARGATSSASPGAATQSGEASVVSITVSAKDHPCHQERSPAKLANQCGASPHHRSFG